MKANNNKNTTK